MANNTSQSGRIKEHRIDIGAQVGIQRNWLFAAGGRIKRMTPMPYWSWRPVLDSGTGNIQIGSPNPRLLTT
jgi:hypothetical protein